VGETMPANEMRSEFHAFTLRRIGWSMDLIDLRQLARQPGVRALYRVTAHYHDMRARNSVATLRRSGATEAVMEVVYQGWFQHKPLVYPVELDRYDALVMGLQRLRFDSLSDQPVLPAHGADLWLVERAAGSFTKSVIVAPEFAFGEYAALVEAVRMYLPESLRQIT